MAINKNHEFEELNGVKCAIVEKNATKERVEFLRNLLEFNKYTVIVAVSPPPKAAAPTPSPAPVSTTGGETVVAPPPSPPPTPDLSSDALTKEEALAKSETFTIGVTDVSFNPTNALYGRLLHTPDGHVVTVAYWQQKETISDDEVPYFEKKN